MNRIIFAIRIISFASSLNHIIAGLTNENSLGVFFVKNTEATYVFGPSCVLDVCSKVNLYQSICQA